MSETSGLETSLTPLLTRLMADETSELEMEIRFGAIHRGKKAYFQTGVSRDWLEAVRAYLEQAGGVLMSQDHFRQYKAGQKRVRLFDNGKKEVIYKRILTTRDVKLRKGKDIRISLAREKTAEMPRLAGEEYKLVSRLTYRLDGFSFDLTKTKHFGGNKWENRVELELVNARQKSINGLTLPTDLGRIIETVAAIA